MEEGGNTNRCRGNSDKSTDDSGAETYCRPFAVQSVIEENPGDTASSSCRMRNKTRHNSPRIRRQRRTAIKAKPPNPEKHRAEYHMRNIMRAIRQSRRSRVPRATAQHQGVSERGSAGGNMHWCPAGEVEPAKDKGPPVGVPGPAGEGVVDERCPDEDEDDGGEHAAAVGGGADGQSSTWRLLVCRACW